MAEYDVVILGGKIVDGTGNPWYNADVGIKDGRIARIGSLNRADAEKSIDASGLIVCPGFIDMHTHSDLTLLADGDGHSKVRQGVTLDIIGESNSVGPITGFAADEYRTEQGTRYGVEVDWNDFEGYFARLLRQGTSMNIASSVSPQQVRLAVVGFESRAATDEEKMMMNDLVEEAMRQGALGLCSAWHGGGPEFVDEVAGMAKVAAHYGGYYGTHIGSEGFEIVEELEKALRIGKSAQIPVHVYHLKARGRDNWGRVAEAIRMIESARAEGLEVTANQYPYTAMQHPWHRLMPRWVQDTPRKEAIPLFADRDFRERIKNDAEFKQYIHEHGGWEGIVMSTATNPALKQFEGKTVAQIAAIRDNSDPLETCFDIVFENGTFPAGVYHNMAEDDVHTIMRRPWVSIASDGSALKEDEPGLPHPRSFGTNVRVLGKYVREEGVLELEDAVRKMTSLPAQTLRLRDRGILREGYWADVVVFDADTVADKATFELPKQYAEGVPYVLVNGRLVIDEGEHTGARPGTVVYGPGYSPPKP
jgi:N-acyl-D-amino-acid deacylase